MSADPVHGLPVLFVAVGGSVRFAVTFFKGEASRGCVYVSRYPGGRNVMSHHMERVPKS